MQTKKCVAQNDRAEHLNKYCTSAWQTVKKKKRTFFQGNNIKQVTK
jgi:hypothetical protein